MEKYKTFINIISTTFRQKVIEINGFSYIINLHLFNFQTT